MEKKNYIGSHKVEIVDGDTVKIMMFPKMGGHVIYSWSNVDNLTLVESKPKCKFNENDQVEIITEVHFARGNHYFQGEKVCISEIRDDRIRIDLIDPISSKWDYISIEDANKYLKYPESKPKWSVGTYVEILSTKIDLENCNIGDVLKIAQEYDADRKYLKKTDGSMIYTASIDYLNEMESYGRFKWHENKPEKEEEEFDLVKLDARIDEIIWNNKKYWEEYRNSIAKYKGATAGKTVTCELSPEDMDKNYPTGEFDEATLQDVSRYMRSQGVRPPYHIYPERLADCFKFGHDILSKPEIKISKQKKINININKPII
jgi:hypothetical protein